jgi:hypothetical protein
VLHGIVLIGITQCKYIVVMDAGMTTKEKFSTDSNLGSTIMFVSFLGDLSAIPLAIQDQNSRKRKRERFSTRPHS